MRKNKEYTGLNTMVKIEKKKMDINQNKSKNCENYF